MQQSIILKTKNMPCSACSGGFNRKIKDLRPLDDLKNNLNGNKSFPESKGSKDVIENLLQIKDKAIKDMMESKELLQAEISPIDDQGDNSTSKISVALIVFISISLSVLLIYWYVLYRRRNKHYHQIMARHEAEQPTSDFNSSFHYYSS